MSAYTDYQDWFANTPSGHSQDWAGGQISKGKGGIASYTDPLGQSHTLTSRSSLADLYGQSPYIAQQWDEQYPGVFSQGPTFDIPTDVFPSSSSKDSSYSGLPSKYQKQILEGIIPSLLASIQNMPGNIDQYLEDAMNTYSGTFKNMASQAMPNILNESFGRNMQDSSIAEDITSNVMSNIISNLQPQAYQTAMQGALMKAGMPGLLSQIAGNLGRYSTGQSSAKQSNPLAPYQLAAQMLLAT